MTMEEYLHPTEFFDCDKTSVNQKALEILSSGHSINLAIKLENYLAMHSTRKKYGKYPISFI